uniref:Uncharacterized protein n=1 Tax=Trichogramma kaykai TaxID=54128 RepID=A0ABD2WKV3_9HYME
MARALDGYSLVEKFKVLPLKAVESYILDSTHHLEKNWFDLNYIDEFGLTHFHVACRYGCEEVVRRFLDLGHDPNLLVQEIRDSPLLLALNWRHKQVAELLLRRGAYWNLPNVNGLTPLHVTC